MSRRCELLAEFVDLSSQFAQSALTSKESAAFETSFKESQMRSQDINLVIRLITQLDRRHREAERKRRADGYSAGYFNAKAAAAKAIEALAPPDPAA